MATLMKKKNVGVTQSKRPFTSPIASAIVTIIAVLWTIPTFGLVVTSLRKKEDISSTGWWSAFTNPHFTFDNFRAVLSTGSGEVGTQGMLPFAINSLAITIPAVVLSVGFGLMAAYALAWIPFRWYARDVDDHCTMRNPNCKRNRCQRYLPVKRICTEP
jgi:alpha-glucoside transport system permease protein